MDFASGKTDGRWPEVVEGAKDEPSIMVVHSSKLDGNVLDQLPLDADVAAITKETKH